MIGAVIAKSLVRSSYDAMNRGDTPAIMSGWRDDATFTYPGRISVSGTRKGKQEIEEWFRHFIEAVPTRTFRPLSVSVENIFDLVGNNVIAVQWEDRPVNRPARSSTYEASPSRPYGGARSPPRPSTSWTVTSYRGCGVRLLRSRRP
jgi:ketosteroid isomerase-like protein